MKRLLFAFSAILFALGLLAFSFFRSENIAPVALPAVSGALSGSGIFAISASGADWDIVLGGSSGGISVQKLSPLSSVFARADQNEIRINADEKGEQKISIDRGRYVFSFEDSLASFVVEFPTFSIRQVSRGTFMVDTTDTSNIRIYSISSILSVSLFSLDNKEEKQTEALIFPSMLFEHNPKFNEELKSADILRVATIHSLSYVPLFTTEGISPLIATSRDIKNLLEASIAFLRKQDQDAALSVTSLLSQKTGYETALFDMFPFLFVNSDKRAILLQNLVFQDLQKLFELSVKTDCRKNSCEPGKIFSSIELKLLDLRDIDEAEYQKGLALIRSAYYIAYAKSASNAEETNRVNPFILLLKRVFKDSISIDSMEYTTLSSMYRDEVLRGKGESSISKKLDSYLRSIISEKAIRQTDFLSFVFFLKEYLSHPMPKIGTSELDIVYYLIALSNEYYVTLGNDNEKFSLLSVYFYNYEKIIGRISQNIVANFFQSGDPLLLKSEFKGGDGEAIMEDGFVASMGAISKAFTETDPYFSTQLSLYYALLNSGRDGNIADRFTVFQATMKNFSDIGSMLANYKSYTDRLALKEDARGAQGIVFSGATFPSEEEIRTYFSQFSGMIPESLKITGGGEKE